MNDFMHEKLVAARQLRRKTQKEVVADLEIAQSTLSKAENGLATLPDDIIEKLSSYYDLPIDFFTGDKALQPTGTIYYRRKQTITNKTSDCFKAKIRIFKNIVDNVMCTVETPDYTLGNYNPLEISPKEIAHQVRFSMKIARGPVPELAALLENNGVIILKFDFGTDKIDGITTITQDEKKIMLINSMMPNDRIRFSMAHELGHLVMHVANPPIEPELAEIQADEFASEFLMPEEDITPMLYNLSFQSLSILKKRWGVSMHALVRKAKDLEIISYQQYRNFQMFFSKKRYTKNEPFPIKPDTPMMWAETLRLYKTDLGYTNEDLMTLMKINSLDYHDWFVPKTNIIKLKFPQRMF